MTQQLDHIFRRASRLPEEEQQQFAKQVAVLLERLEQEATEPEASKPLSPTGYELSKHLAGIIEGPRDLSYNPKYMEGFGESTQR